MKLLVLFGALLLGVWLWRSGRNSDTKNVPPRPPPAAQTDMVQCLHCSVHMPVAEAVPGRLGLYCNREHRQLAEP